jgi:uncharacterized protein (TIGR02145 family)
LQIGAGTADLTSITIPDSVTSIGNDAFTTGTFAEINWANGPYFIKTETDPLGGTNYTITGTQEILSVPYALNGITKAQADSIVAMQAQITTLQAQLTAGQVAYPFLTTTAIAEITKITATAGGNITSNGNATITARGVCWSTTANPTVALTTKTVDGEGIGVFASTITGLTANTTYYLRAYATNSFGTAYGLQVSFKTLTSNAAPLPNVTIGTQIWTSENLDVTTYSDGTPIQQVTDPTQWGNLTTGAWCYYNNGSANGTTYGKLYNWYAVAGIHDTDPSTPNKILAPTGWHVPSDPEWTTLTTFLGGDNVAGGKMKATGTSLWISPNGDATNASGFTGLPGGIRYFNGVFFGIGFNGSWWSSSDYSSPNVGPRVGYLNLSYGSGSAEITVASKDYGFSVRCLGD